jgi:hypothetical protein
MTRLGVGLAGREEAISSCGENSPCGMRGAAGTVASSSRFRIVSWLPSFLVLLPVRLFSSNKKRVPIRSEKSKLDTYY